MLELFFLLLPVAMGYGWFMGRKVSSQRDPSEIRRARLVLNEHEWKPKEEQRAGDDHADEAHRPERLLFDI